ncbi:Uncharacterized protein BP5553_03027 [Venustampulla echinocandica]|uniref:Chromatin assembly factor 1 subunit A n=1 Tax=Venustampulla echinocandica TaxID=2656787 RepID=A0A370TT34_9HELO|nr:Uncharacterized protein BP5553_03027 [Venustampulla echinocandica]RDL38687.1 Uncharacterized protein BP5553_03027 [Venustampulla echinocandica]
MSVHESARSLKRNHDSFEGRADLKESHTAAADFLQTLPIPPTPTNTSKRNLSPAQSNSSPLSDVGPVTPSAVLNSPKLATGAGPNASVNTSSPSAFAALNGAAAPPAKKTKLTFAEKEMRQIQKDIREQEKAEERAKKEAEKQVQAEEKARRDAEKEAERKRKEAEKQLQIEEKARRDAEKEAEKKRREAEREEKRAAQEAEKAAKEEKKLLREKEKQRVEEEKMKKERSQPTLSSFFAAPSKARTGSADGKEKRPASPGPQNSNPSLLAASTVNPQATTPSKPEISPYDKMFPAFFIHSDVKVASVNRFERDDEALNSIHQTLDSYIFGDRSPDRKLTFDIISLFHLPDNTGPRGKNCMPVREIMAEFSGDASRPIDLTEDSQISQVRRMRNLRRVPMKILQFREDVRPPYRGTYTSRPVHGVAKLGRNPLRRDLPNTNYDYDSEAEWVEDEDAEDCNSDGEEEDDGEDGEDMEGFLDDENDELAHSKRMIIQGDLEPVSTGLCWESRKKRNTGVEMMQYRMEIIVDPNLKSVNPFSTQYWVPNPTTTAMEPPRLPLTAVKPPNTSTAILPSSTIKVTSFFPLTTSTTSTTASLSSQQALQTISTPGKDTKPKKLLPAEDLPKFRDAVEGSNLSKIGLIEVLKKQFPGRPAAAIKGTLETVAKRIGAKEADKRWVIVEGM